MRDFNKAIAPAGVMGPGFGIGPRRGRRKSLIQCQLPFGEAFPSNTKESVHQPTLSTPPPRALQRADSVILVLPRRSVTGPWAVSWPLLVGALALLCVLSNPPSPPWPQSFEIFSHSPELLSTQAQNAYTTNVRSSDFRKLKLPLCQTFKETQFFCVSRRWKPHPGVGRPNLVPPSSHAPTSLWHTP